MKVKSVTGILLVTALLILLCSCDLIDGIYGPRGTETAPQTHTESTSAQTTKRPVRIITDVPTTAPAKAETLCLEVLRKEKEKDGNKKAFLFDGSANDTPELFILTAYETRCICDVYYFENGSAVKKIDGCEVCEGNAEEYYAGVAKKSGGYYLFTYAKTRYGNEYTVRYTFTDLKTCETATVAEDYRHKDKSADKSIHEYTVNGESVSENEYIIAREAYSIICATEKTEKENVESVGMTISEMIKALS